LELCQLAGLLFAAASGVIEGSWIELAVTVRVQDVIRIHDHKAERQAETLIATNLKNQKRETCQINP